jgi:hypothetical protein
MNGPIVDPCAGPNRGVSLVLLYDSCDTPYGVLMLCVVCDHVLAREVVADLGAPSRRN